ncbi:SIS domain-containing protein [Thermoanaerobacter uzonensis]|uniref:SIS domain-containing protein n=1 Tax=Thermoanaerobacter uzonensis TaxID=447593 RepID=UPI003D766C30
MSFLRYFEVVEELIKELKDTQHENIRKASEIIANSIINGGILHSFGSGHSYASAIEIAGRAGSLIPAKTVEEPSRGLYETIEGVGTKLMENYDLRENDCFVIISNSGRNPLVIEVADFVKRKGNKLIVVTSLDVSKKLKSRHSSGKNLYQFADVILDNRGKEGDSVIELDGLPVKVGPTSTIAAVVLLQATIVEAVKIMLSMGYTPPIYMSANIDGGPEFNKKLIEKYVERLFTEY